MAENKSKPKVPLFAQVLKYLLLFILLFVVYRLGEAIGRDGLTPMEALQSLPQILFGGNAPVKPPAAPAVELYLDYYTILVGRFASEDGAKSLRSDLTQNRIRSTTIEHQGYFFVVVGRFPTRASAKDMLETVRAKGYPNARLIEKSQ